MAAFTAATSAAAERRAADRATARAARQAAPVAQALAAVPEERVRGQSPRKSEMDVTLPQSRPFPRGNPNPKNIAI